MTTSPGGVHVLDSPALSSLRGAHSRLGRDSGRVSRYDPAISPFAGLPADADSDDWGQLASLVGPGNEAVLFGVPSFVPEWQATFRIGCLQMTGATLVPSAEPEAVVLSGTDVPEMLDLVARTRPGPFCARTIEMGCYVGLRIGGVLVAMAGERMHPPGWTEISGVCTDPAFCRRGLGARLIRSVAMLAAVRDERSYLHVVAANAGAVRLYAALGFEVRREIDVAGFTVPEPGSW